MSSPTPRRWHRHTLLLVLALIGAANAFVCFVRLTEPAPLTPWEPAIAMEGVRFTRGLPLYELSHATHMYGPLLTIATAGVLEMTGFNLIAARIAFSLCGIALGALLATLLCRGGRRSWWLAAFVLFSAINLRTDFIFVSAQPDCVAALLALIALCLWAHPKSSFLLRSVALGLFLAAVLFKQTSAVFALILPMNVLLRGRPFSWEKLFFACVPALAIGLQIALIYVADPSLFRAMITIPASIHVSVGRVISGSLFLLATFPVFYLGVAAVLIGPQSITEMDRWIGASLVVLLPTAVWMLGKSGGSYNSLLFAYLAIVALVVSQLPSIMQWIESVSVSQGFASTLTLAVALVGSYFFPFDHSLKLLSARHGDEKVEAAIAVIRQVGGNVISPEDPSIAYRANGYVGRSVFFELDAHAVRGQWPATLPAQMDRELDGAKGVIEVRGYVPLPLFRQTLIKKRFLLMEPPALEDSAYTLWIRPENVRQ